MPAVNVQKFHISGPEAGSDVIPVKYLDKKHEIVVSKPTITINRVKLLQRVMNICSFRSRIMLKYSLVQDFGEKTDFLNDFTLHSFKIGH